MEQTEQLIPTSRPAFVQAYNGVASVEEARAKRPANIGIRASEDGETEIVEIFDEIGGWGVWASELIPHLRRIDGAGKKVEVRLNSPGGDVFEGVAIANAIRFMKADTTSVVYGLAASAASVIAVSTDELLMPANSMLMIHRPWMIAWGEAKDLRDGAELLDKIEVQLVDTYAAKAKEAKRDDLAQMVADETWLTAEESVAVGLADRILDDVKMAASAARDIRTRRDVPAQAIALLAGPDTTESTEETAVSDETPSAEETPAASVEVQASVAEATEQETDPVEVIEPAVEASADADQDPAPTIASDEPAAAAEAVVEDAAEELTEAAVETTPGAAAAEDGYPLQDAPTAERTEEAIAIRAACAVLDASDKADSFIAAGMNFEQVRKALWDHRVANATQNEISTQGSVLLAENPADAAKPQSSDGPSDLKRAYAARKGRTK